MARIPRLPFKRLPGAQAHPYPFQIALQTQEFLHGTLFRAIFTDVATREAILRDEGVSNIERRMKEMGMIPQEIDRGWGVLRKYKNVFEGAVFQSALISLCSHWDWYVRRLTKFIEFGRAQLKVAALDASTEKI